MMFSLSLWDLCAAILLACLFCHPLDCLWATVRGCGHCCWSLCSLQCCCNPSSLPSVPDINRLCDLCGCLGLRCCLCDCPMCDICLQATECLDLAMEISQMLYHWCCWELKKRKKKWEKTDAQNPIGTFFYLLKSSGKRATLHKQDTRFAVNSQKHSSICQGKTWEILFMSGNTRLCIFLLFRKIRSVRLNFFKTPWSINYQYVFFFIISRIKNV